MFHGVNVYFNLSETLAIKFTTGNDDDPLVEALTTSELVNEVGQAAHIIKAFDATHHDNRSLASVITCRVVVLPI